MVVFTCSYCGDSVNKPKVEKHYQTRCRGKVPNLSCMDCFKDFYGADHEAHTKCITEEQRYGGVGFVATAKKGESKQEAWVQLVQQALSNNNNTSPQANRILQEVSKHSNTPRKKAKFINFVKNVCGHRTMPADIDAAWDILAKQLDILRQNNAATNKQAAAKQETNASNTNGNVEIKIKEDTEAREISVKSKKKKKNGLEEIENIAEEDCARDKINGSTDEKEVEKQKKKKKKQNGQTEIGDILELEKINENADEKHGKVEEVVLEMSEKQKKKKKRKASENDSAETSEQVDILSEQTVEINSEVTSKKEKKKKKQKIGNENTENGELQTTEEVKEDNAAEQNASENDTNDRPKKKKKNKNGSFTESSEYIEAGNEESSIQTDQTGKKRKHDDVEENIPAENGTSNKPKKNKKRKSEICEEIIERKEDNQPNFPWVEKIEAVLKEKGGRLKLNKVSKTVLKQFTQATGEQADESVMRKLTNIIMNTATLQLDNNMVTLVEITG